MQSPGYLPEDRQLNVKVYMEWVIDQYQVSTDKRSGITSDPNRPDDEQYIVRLVGKVIAVSVETVKLVEELAEVVKLEDYMSMAIGEK